MFEKIEVKRTLSVRIEQCDLDTYLISKGWKKAFGGWSLNEGREMMGCLGMQMTVKQLGFVEKRDSFLVFQDIDAIRKDRIALAWEAAIEQHGVTAFTFFAWLGNKEEFHFIDNNSVSREIALGNVYLREQGNESDTGKEV